MEDEMCLACSTNGEKRNAYRILVGKPEVKRPLGRPRRRWEDNFRMDLREIGWCGMDWIDLVQDRDQWRALVNTAMNLGWGNDCINGCVSSSSQRFQCNVKMVR
jgi:hypothetical protein